MMRTFKIYSLGNFQVLNAVLSAVPTMLYPGDRMIPETCVFTAERFAVCPLCTVAAGVVSN